MSLATLQKLFQEYFFENNTIIEKQIAKPPKGKVLDRLSIYGQGYIARLEEALADDFSTLKALLGENNFFKLTYNYINNHPSIYFSISHYGEKFPQFLTTFKVHYAEIAAFEWAESFAITAKNANVLAREDIQKITIENWPAAKFNLHPSLQLLKQQWNTLEIIQSLRNSQKPPKAKRLANPITVIVWRKEIEIFYCPIEPVETKLLVAIQNEYSFAEICELLCDDLPENKVAEYVANKFLLYVDRELLIN